MIERALDEGAAVQPRVWLEALEPRRMMDASRAAAVFDPAFGAGGVAAVAFPTSAGESQHPWVHLVAAPGGQFYAVTALAGNFDAFEAVGVARFNADGSLDQTFGSGGATALRFAPMEYAVSGAYTAWAYDATVQPDGRLVVSVNEELPQQDGSTAFVPVICRLDQDGSPDRTFADGGTFIGNGGVASASATDMYDDVPITQQLPDGTLLSFYTEGSDLVAQRLNADGTPDEAFGSGGQRRYALPGTTVGDSPFIDFGLLASGGGDVSVGGVDGMGLYTLRFDADWNEVGVQALPLPPDADFNVDELGLDGDGGTYVQGGGRLFHFDAAGVMTGGGPIGENLYFDGLFDVEIDAGGNLDAYAGPEGVVDRFTPDGQRDPSFAGGAGIDGLPVGGDNPAASVGLLPNADGSMIVATLLQSQGRMTLVLQRLQPGDDVGDGSLPIMAMPQSGDDRVASLAAASADAPIVQGFVDVGQPPVQAAAPTQGGPAATEDGGGGDDPGGTTAGLPDVPAAWAAGAQASQGVGTQTSPERLFDAAAGATLFDPDGTAVLN